MWQSRWRVSAIGARAEPRWLTAFNYPHGRQEGVELTASYDRGRWSIYGNLAWSRALGNDIVSAQFNFGPDELAFIANNFIHLNHDQTWNGSAGVAYTLSRETDHPTLFSIDASLQSGFRPARQRLPMASPCRPTSRGWSRC
jgi:hypothetical protein